MREFTGAVSEIIQKYKETYSPHAKSAEYAIRLQCLSYQLMAASVDKTGYTHNLEEVFYCYVYLNPLKPGKFRYILPSGKVVVFDCEPYYVGKGRGARLDAHVRDAQKSKAYSHKLNTIRKIIKAGLEPKRVATASLVDESIALAFEIDLIAGIGRRDKSKGPLTNQTDGGEGATGATPSEATLKKRSLSLAKFFASMSPAERREHNEQVSDAVREGLARLPDEVREAARTAATTSLTRFWEGTSATHKKEHGEKVRRAHAAKPPSEKAEQSWNISQGLLNRSETDKELTRKHKSRSAKRMHANRTAEQKAEVYRKSSKSLRKFHAALSAEEKAAHYVPAIESTKRRMRETHSKYLRIFFGTLAYVTDYKTYEELRALMPEIPRCTLTSLLKEYTKDGLLITRQKGARYPKLYLYA